MSYLLLPVHIRVEGALIVGDGKIVSVSGDCILCEVLQEVGFGDRVDDVVVVVVLYGSRTQRRERVWYEASLRCEL